MVARAMVEERITAIETALGGVIATTANLVTRLDALGSRMDNASQVFLVEQGRIHDLEEAIKVNGRTKTTKEWKPLLESKATQNLVKLGSNRSEYRGWAERLTNALEAMRPGARTLFKVLGC